MEEEKEQKWRESEERARLHEEQQAKHVQHEAKCLCTAYYNGSNAQQCASLMQMMSSFVDSVKEKIKALLIWWHLLKWKHPLRSLHFSKTTCVHVNSVGASDEASNLLQ